jgi:hypothetical protein
MLISVESINVRENRRSNQEWTSKETGNTEHTTQKQDKQYKTKTPKIKI